MTGLADIPVSAFLPAAFGPTRFCRSAEAPSAGASGRPPLNPSVRDLTSGLAPRERSGTGDGEVRCLITDSRRVVPGALFFAIGGRRTNGNYFVEEAVDRGAVAVVSEEPPGTHFPIDYIVVDDARAALAEAAKRFYGAPDERLTLLGVTGTNGKTTATMLTQHLMGGDDRVGLIGTVRYDLGRRTLPAFRTTPESVDIHALLAEAEKNSCGEVVMEISSHGIDQKRVQGLGVDIAAFLNLTQDHIDYHDSMEAYYRTKRGLFDGSIGAPPRVAAINVDDPYGRRLLGELPAGVEAVTFGEAEDADLRATSIQLFADRTVFELVWPGGRERLVFMLPGRYNVSNLLAALAIARAAGRDVPSLLGRAGSFPGVPGRMELVSEGRAPFNVRVDYAHTPDALRHACAMLRDITPGRVLVVFGCGGDRDRAKRRLMTEAVLQGADEAWATADNPRHEALESIFSDMRSAVGANDPIHFIDDRRRAIGSALEAARPGDCVLIAGKGHETYQEFDGAVIPFDDREVARELLDVKGMNPGKAER